MQQYPLTISFDLWSMPPKMAVKDLQGNTLMRIARSLTLKEQLEVTAYQNHQQQVYKIATEKLLSSNPVYDIWNSQGQTIGMIKRRNRNFLLDSQYSVWDSNDLIFQIQEESNPRWLTGLLVVAMMALALAIFTSQIPTLRMIGFLPFLISIISALGFSTGHFLNPLYTVQRPDGKRVMQFAKIPEFNLHTSRFAIKSIDQVSEAEEYSALFGIILMILNERSKG